MHLSCEETTFPHDRGGMSTDSDADSIPLHDMHCHLDFARDAQSIANDAEASNALIFANTVTPLGFHEAQKQLAISKNVKLGLGLHPWYIEHVGTLRQQLESFHEQLPSTRFVGEIGLDFSKRKASSADKQLEAFESVCAACGSAGGKTLSLHAIKSADVVLDALVEYNVLDSCKCIFHWFSGSNEQLWRAIKAGCYFSVGPFMANSRRGREYIKIIPSGQLLLETDFPPTGDRATYDSITNEPRVNLDFTQIREALETAAGVVKERKGDDILLEIDETSRRLLSD